MTKRRRAVLLARQRGRDMANMARVAHGIAAERDNETARADTLAAQLAKAGADLEAARRTPRYMDAEGREGPDHISSAFRHARTAIDRAKGLEAQLQEERERVAMMREGAERLGQHVQAATLRAIKAEKALAAVTARKNGWPPAVRSVNVQFAA